MKKLTLLLACFTMGMSLNAQNNNATVPPEPIEQSSFSIGFTGGFGHAFLMPYSNTVFRPSWDAGISAIYSPWKHWGIGLDALYSVEGAKFKYSGTAGSSDYTVQTELDYVRVPLKAIYFFRTYEADFRPKITLGPTLGILVNDANRPNAQSVDFGANVSLGFNYRIARAIWINVDASYYQGFLDAYSGNSERDLNGNARLNAGINFGF